MPWPAMADFNDAVQTPERCFEWRELAQGTTVVKPGGLPLVYSGNFACVYKIATGSGDFAVRCFTREVKNQQERYGHLSNYLKSLEDVIPQDAFVGFEYIERGIRVRGEWYPIVKMEWAPGDRLDKFVEDHLGTPGAYSDLAARWRRLNITLRGLRIAHNDLQHGNVMVQDQGALRLVDYDGIFLPRFQGEDSPELGHEHYQHPKRSTPDYYAEIDNFPSLVVYLSLLALNADPQLWDRFYNQNNMLFTRDDFADPGNSDCFKALKSSPDTNVAGLADVLEELCDRPVDQVPDLESVLHGNLTAPLPAPVVTPPPDASPADMAAGTSYREMLQNDQSAPPAPINAPADTTPSPVLTCPGCNRTYPSDLIFCTDEGCLAVLHPGRQACGSCGSSIPLNAYFCRECGFRLAAPTTV